MNKAWLVVVAMVLLALPGPVLAQQNNPTKWGVTFGVAPWQVPPSIKEIFDVNEINVKGLDIEIGAVRGKSTGGDWGVSFVRKGINSDSTVQRGGGSYCVGSLGCVRLGTTYTAKNMALNGAKIHKFFSFGTIKRRVQIGLNLAGGAAKISGTVDKTTQTLKYTFGPNGQITGIGTANKTEAVSAGELFGSNVKTIPLLDLQLGVGVIITPQIKLKVLGGLNFPGTGATVNLVYLFGKR